MSERNILRISLFNRKFATQPSAKSVEENLGKRLHELTTDQINDTVKELSHATNKAIKAMKHYELEQRQSQ